MQLFKKVHIEFVVTGGQIYQTKNVGFQNTKITQQSKIKEKETEIKKHQYTQSP